MVRIETALNILAYVVAALGFIPLFPYLEAVPRVLFPLALISGIMADRRGYRLRGRLPTVISLVFFAFYTVQFSRDNLVGPAVNLLVILLAVRLLCEKSGRNYLQIYALSLFSLAGSSLFSLSAAFLLYLVLLLVLTAVSLVILAFYTEECGLVISRPAFKKVLYVALLMPAAALPLMLIFFFILPRAQYPIWNFLNGGGAKRTGFSEKVEPGKSANVSEVKNIAFRAKCEKLEKGQLYWRGIVLNAFAGGGWVRREPPSGEGNSLGKGRAVNQTIFPEPGRTGYLMALNIPRQVSGIRNSVSADYTIRTSSAAAGRVKYAAVSVLGGAIKTHRGIDRAFYLELPPRLSGRMLALGRDIARKGRSDAEKVALLEAFFRAQRISYATTDLPVTGEPLDMFLFEKRRGNCEFFASSCATLLRAAGVPARLVGGYYGGEYNDLGGYYAVTEDMAHVWVEAYINGQGWVKIDPSSWAVNFSEVGERGRPGLGTRLSMSLDAFSYYWNLAVINYDLERQLQLFNGAGHELKRLKFPARLETSLVLLLPLTILAAIIAVRRRGKVSREGRMLQRFFRRVRKRCGVEPGPTTGLYELAAKLHNPVVDEFVVIYGAALYRDRRLSAAEIDRLKGLIRRL